MLDKGGGPDQPRGREAVVDGLVAATLELWTDSGTSSLSLRNVAARAGVNYGLIHRHFGTRESLIQAAMDRVVRRSDDAILDAESLEDVICQVLPRSTGAHARLLAWAVLEGKLEDVVPDQDGFVDSVRGIAELEFGEEHGEEHARFIAATVVATLYGWKLFQSYLLPAFELEGLDAAEFERKLHRALLHVLELRADS